MTVVGGSEYRRGGGGRSPAPPSPHGRREWPGPQGCSLAAAIQHPGGWGPPRAARSLARPKGGMPPGRCSGDPGREGPRAGCAGQARVRGESWGWRAGEAGGHPELPDPWAKAGPCEAGLSPAHVPTQESGRHPAPPGSVPDTSPHVIPSAACFTENTEAQGRGGTRLKGQASRGPGFGRRCVLFGSCQVQVPSVVSEGWTLSQRRGGEGLGPAAGSQGRPSQPSGRAHRSGPPPPPRHPAPHQEEGCRVEGSWK